MKKNKDDPCEMILILVMGRILPRKSGFSGMYKKWAEHENFTGILEKYQSIWVLQPMELPEPETRFSGITRSFTIILWPAVVAAVLTAYTLLQDK